MKGIYNKTTHKFKTYDDWTEYEQTDKAKTIKGLEDVLLFTSGEAYRNALKQPLEWRHINPRVNWRMIR